VDSTLTGGSFIWLRPLPLSITSGQDFLYALIADAVMYYRPRVSRIRTPAAAAFRWSSLPSTK
jgi:hypothetical protein